MAGVLLYEWLGVYVTATDREHAKLVIEAWLTHEDMTLADVIVSRVDANLDDQEWRDSAAYRWHARAPWEFLVLVRFDEYIEIPFEDLPRLDAIPGHVVGGRFIAGFAGVTGAQAHRWNEVLPAEWTWDPEDV